MRVVLDASAVLAWLQDEPGAEAVDEALYDGTVSAANWAEVLQKVRDSGRDADETSLLLRALGVVVTDVTRGDGECAAELWSRDRPLSLGDRLCLATASRLGLPVLTAERVWATVDHGVEVRLIR